MGPVLKEHKNYVNALRHARACFLMSKEPTVLQKDYCEDFFVLQESDDMNPPMAILNYKKYTQQEEVYRFLDINSNLIQCVAGTENLSLGKTQFPAFTDYADGLNTLEWLRRL